MELSTMANQITVNSGTGNITVTTSRAVIGTVANVASANYANFAGEVVDASQPNITSVGTLSNLNVATTITTQDLVVTGNFSVGNLIANSANFANFAGEVVDASQPNITSVGILNGLVVSGNITPNANITYNLGNNTNRFNDLYLANSTIYLGAQQISANATSVNFSQDVSITGNLQIGNLVANSANFANFAGTANTANAVAGANVSGTVANATFATTSGTANSATVANSANSVALANVSGAGNIASINLTGSTSNVLFGNGVFGPVTATLSGDGGNISNIQGANVSGAVGLATFATTANAVAGANVSGTVANATYADNAGNANTANSATVANSANAVAGANVTGTVANATFATSAGSANTANSATIANSANSVTLANVSGAGNIASINLSGSTSNVLFGNGVFASIPSVPLSGDGGNISNIQGANVSGAVGLATFATTANAVAGGNVSGAVAYATTANSVAGANVSGAVANATYAVTAGTADSVAGANVSGAVSFATTANSVAGANVSGAVGLATFATTANAVAGANVSGEVANANYASFANIANSANAVAVANVSGIGNIATVNLDGNASNILYGNGSFAAPAIISNVANANYANFAGTAYSVSGSNVSGEVANANFASYSNVANSANAVAGANVSGTVANATFALDAANANVANTANSVAVANVSGIGNIATVNLDGNVSNLLTGNGTFVAIPTVSANANYANFAGDVVNSSQSNITSVGNLVSLQVGNNAANTATTKFTPVGANITALSGNIFVNNTRVSKDDADVLANGTSTQDAIINPYDSANVSGQSYQLNYLVQDLANTANIAIAGSDTFSFEYGAGNAAAPGDRTISLYTRDSELANANPDTTLDISMGASGILINRKMPNDAAAIAGSGLLSMINYGELSDPADATGIVMSRRRGNNSVPSGNAAVNSREPVVANDYLGNIAWRGAGTSTGTVNSKRAVIGAKVDNSYGGPGNVMPIGMEMTVVNSSNTQLSHSFYANGDVNFTNTVNATNFTGNGSGLTNLQPTQIINGNSNASFTGAGGDLNITIDNNQYATFFSNRKLQLSGIEADSGNASQLVLDNGGLVLVQEDLGGGFASFDFKSYFSTGFIAPYTFYRARGNINSPNNVQSGDAVTTQSYIVYGDSGNTFVNIGTYSATVTANDGAGNVQSRIEIATNRNDNGSEVKLNADKLVLQGNSLIELNATNSNVSGNLNGTGSINFGALSSANLTVTDTTTSKIIRQDLGTANLTPGTTLNLAATSEQYVKITLTTYGNTQTSTINCANLDTSGYGKTYKFLVFNNSGQTQNVTSSGLAQVNPTTSLTNGYYGLLQVDTFGTDGSGVWIWSNLA